MKNFGAEVIIGIEPAVANYSWTDFFRYQELIRIGETAAELKLGEIRNAVKTKFGDEGLQWPKRIFDPKPKSSEMLTY